MDDGGNLQIRTHDTKLHMGTCKFCTYVPAACADGGVDWYLPLYLEAS